MLTADLLGLYRSMTGVPVSSKQWYLTSLIQQRLQLPLPTAGLLGLCRSMTRSRVKQTVMSHQSNLRTSATACTNSRPAGIVQINARCSTVKCTVVSQKSYSTASATACANSRPVGTVQINDTLQGQVANLQNDNQSFQTRVTALQDTTSSLSSQIGTLAKQAQSAANAANQLGVRRPVTTS